MVFHPAARLRREARAGHPVEVVRTAPRGELAPPGIPADNHRASGTAIGKDKGSGRAKGGAAAPKAAASAMRVALLLINLLNSVKVSSPAKNNIFSMLRAKTITRVHTISFR